ncbi:MAG: RNA polymerase sigma factor [Eubacterium sp.]|nr:RNA polymerase sigma factor [Eubacterium sp.]
MDVDFLLLMKMKQGEEDAFDKFIRKYYEEILKYCTYHCFDSEYARDLTQETFLRFFANLSAYQYCGKTKNYLYTIAGNLCKNYYKKKKEDVMDKEGLQAKAGAAADPFAGVLDQMEMQAALAGLSEEFREVLILYYFQELKLKEIAGVLGIGLPLVKYRMRQAKQQLKEFFERRGTWTQI